MAKDSNIGIVYVLSNSVMPGLVKIGMTTRPELDARLKELYTTGVPVPFDVEYACEVKKSNCAKLEKALHTAFEPNRINPNREFFSISKEQAIAILELFNEKDVTIEVSDEMNHDLTPGDIASKAKAKKHRPPLNFAQMGIPIGSTLTYDADPEITVAVISEKKVDYLGEETSLTAATSKILGLNYGVHPTNRWSYKGKNLQDIYDETYPFAES